MSPLYDKVYNYLNNSLKAVFFEKLDGRLSHTAKIAKRNKPYLLDIYSKLNSGNVYLYDKINQSYLKNDYKSWINEDKLNKNTINDIATFKLADKQDFKKLDKIISKLDPNNDKSIFQNSKIIKNNFNVDKLEALNEVMNDIKNNLKEWGAKVEYYNNNPTETMNSIKKEIKSLNGIIISYFKKHDDFLKIVDLSIETLETILDNIELNADLISEYVETFSNEFIKSDDFGPTYFTKIKNYFVTLDNKYEQQINKIKEKLDVISNLKQDQSYKDEDKIKSIDEDDNDFYRLCMNLKNKASPGDINAVDSFMKKLQDELKQLNKDKEQNSKNIKTFISFFDNVKTKLNDLKPDFDINTHSTDTLDYAVYQYEKLDKYRENIQNQITKLREEKRSNKDQLITNKQYQILDSIADKALEFNSNGTQFFYTISLNPSISVNDIKSVFTKADKDFDILLIDEDDKVYNVNKILDDDILPDKDLINNLLSKEESTNNKLYTEKLNFAQILRGNKNKNTSFNPDFSKDALDYVNSIINNSNIIQQDYDTIVADNEEQKVNNKVYYDNTKNIELYKYDFSTIPDNVKIKQILFNIIVNKASIDYKQLTQIDDDKFIFYSDIDDYSLLDINNVNKFLNNRENIQNLFEKFTAYYTVFTSQDPNKFKGTKYEKPEELKYIQPHTNYIKGFSIEEKEDNALKYMEYLLNDKISKTDFNYIKDNFKELYAYFNNLSFDIPNLVTYSNEKAKINKVNINSFKELVSVMKYIFDYEYINKKLNTANLTANITPTTEILDIIKNVVDLINLNYYDNNINKLYEMVFDSGFSRSLLNNFNTNKQLIDLLQRYFYNNNNKKDLFNKLMKYYIIIYTIDELSFIKYKEGMADSISVEAKHLFDHSGNDLTDNLKNVLHFGLGEMYDNMHFILSAIGNIISNSNYKKILSELLYVPDDSSDDESSDDETKENNNTVRFIKEIEKYLEAIANKVMPEVTND